MRRRLAQQGFGADHGFRWRGGEISRLEGLSDGITTTLTGVLLFIVLFYVYLNVVIGLVSIAIVAVGGPDAAFWSGMAYMLIMPVQTLNGRLMRTRIRQAATAPRQ
jgi:hypothetical protein